MELRNLQYFISVHQELSFSKAAKKCFVSQPSISAAIGQLETELDKKLFIRHAKGASPTQAGKTLYPSAVKVLNEINTMQGMFHGSSPLVPLRIALMPFLSGERIGMVINELITSLPELDLTVVDWNEDADAHIISRSMVLQNEAFHNLWVDDYVLAMSIKHPLADRKEIVLQDLNGLPFISSKFCDARDNWNYALQKYGHDSLEKCLPFGWHHGVFRLQQFFGQKTYRQTDQRGKGLFEASHWAALNRRMDQSQTHDL